MEFNIFDKELAYGLLPFETIYFEKGSPHFLDEHYLRLKRACRVFNVGFNHDLSSFCCSINEAIKDCKDENGVIKVVCYKDIFKINIRKSAYDNSTYDRGLKIRVSKTIRDHENILCYFKTFNYGVNYIEDQRAKEKSFDTALFLNSKGYICETTYANIFFRNENVIYTPDIRNGILNGILRSKVIKSARNLGYEIRKTNISVSSFMNYSECFITNSVAGVFPVKSINEYEFEDRKFVEQINKDNFFIRPWNLQCEK